MCGEVLCRFMHTQSLYSLLWAAAAAGRGPSRRFSYFSQAMAEFYIESLNKNGLYIIYYMMASMTTYYGNYHRIKNVISDTNQTIMH